MVYKKICIAINMGNTLGCESMYLKEKRGLLNPLLHLIYWSLLCLPLSHLHLWFPMLLRHDLENVF